MSYTAHGIVLIGAANLVSAGVAAESAEYKEALRLQDAGDASAALAKAEAGAKKGDPACLRLIGNLYAFGELGGGSESPENAAKARPYYEKAIALGDKEARVSLSRIIYDTGEQLTLLLPIATAEMPDVAYVVAGFYEHGGKGVPVDYAASVRYYRIAADSPLTSADSKAIYERSIESIRKKMTASAAAPAPVNAMPAGAVVPEYAEALALKSDLKYAEALAKAEAGAAKNDPGCLRLAGEIHHSGVLNPRGSSTAEECARRARPYFEKAAALGDTESKVNLGLMADDPDERLRLLVPLVSAERPFLASIVARLYSRGSAKRPASPAEAIKYLEIASAYPGVSDSQKKAFEETIAGLRKRLPNPSTAATPAVAAIPGPRSSSLSGEARKAYFERTLIDSIEATIKALRLRDPARPKAPPEIYNRLTGSFGVANYVFSTNKDAALRSKTRGAALAAYLTELFRSPLPAADADLLARDMVEELVSIDLVAVSYAQSAIDRTWLARITPLIDPHAAAQLQRVRVHAEAVAKGGGGPATPAPYAPGVGVGTPDFDEGITAYNRKHYAVAKPAFERAAGAGLASAAFNLGVMYSKGEGVTKSTAGRDDWYAFSAERLYVGAISLFARFYHNGSDGFAKNIPLALRFYDAAGDLGDASALRVAALMLRNGSGVPKDVPGALARWDRAAAKGDAASAFALGRHWFGEIDVLEPDPVKAKRYFGMVASMKGASAMEKEDAARYLASLNAGKYGAAVAQEIELEAAEADFEKLAAMNEKTKTGPVKPPGAGAPSPAQIVAALPLLPPAPETLRVPVNGTHVKKAKLAKGTPWTAEDIIAALKSGSDPKDISEAMHAECDGSLIDTPGLRRFLASPEAKRITRGSALFRFNLVGRVEAAERKGSEETDRIAASMIADRRRSLGLAAVRELADTPALRARASAGDGRALYELALLCKAAASRAPAFPVSYRPTNEERNKSVSAAADPVLAQLAQSERLLRDASAASGYATAVREKFLAGPYSELDPDKSLATFSACRADAEKGDPHACHALAMTYALGYRTLGIRPGCDEAAYWLVEAAAHGYDTLAGRPDRGRAVEIGTVLLLGGPHGEFALKPGLDDETWRSVRRHLARGGVYERIARDFMAYADTGELGDMSEPAEKRVAALLPEPASVTPDEAVRLAASKDPRDLETLAGALAFGRGVRQDDRRAYALYERAIAAGAGPSARRAIAGQLKYGYGVIRDDAAYIAALRAASLSGEPYDLVSLADVLRYSGKGRQADPKGAIALYDKAGEAGMVAAVFKAAEVSLKSGDAAGYRVRLEKAANAGYAPAFVLMGRRFSDTLDSSERNFDKAVLWYTKAVEAGDGSARGELAKALHYSGKIAEAKARFVQAIEANQGDADAVYHYAELLLETREYPLAAKWFAEYLGRAPSSLIGLGAYEGYDSNSGKKDRAKRFLREYEEETKAAPNSIAYWRKLARVADGNDYTAEFRMGLMMAASADKQVAEEGRWALRRCANAGFAPAVIPSYETEAKSDKPAAEKWLAERVFKGDSQAKLLRAILASGVDKAGTPAKFETLANEGNPDAALRLGLMYVKGEGVARDTTKGLAFVTKSSDSGYALAQLTLGGSLLKGEAGVVAADPVRGVALLEKAARQRVFGPVAAQAAYALARVYDTGEIGAVPRSASKAYEFYGVAIDNGVDNPAVIQRRAALGSEASMEMKGGFRKKGK